ncbi:PepSY domain-containing protein [Aquimarina sp. ERC-38]|uniref:PepSY-associated TM helix domain-containing protein n=1 Tax=Aquimarina sp. ERC-38 TaxID=2949996 RepID=UPI0022452C15|nr:PepSY-associated TM helix domain-containing protein [Aquimarina sp. ERC-38]UZO80629.1 PepSY domain-containing protein [Aquimarina sp. ERC-38]
MVEKKSKKNKRKLILQVHKILGLLTGIVVLIVSITGCLWVFKEEIEGFYDDYSQVAVQELNFIDASQVKTIAESIIPGKTIHGVIYGPPDEALEVVFYEAEPEVFYQSVFLNPYTGEFLKRIDRNSGFFAFVLDGHLHLWLPKAIGSLVVSYAILLFLLIIISGLILWWPKNRKNFRQRLQFHWKSSTRWKRKNFDLHTIIGFYISSFTLIFAFTGCIMAFNWFYFIAYKATGGDKDPRFVVPNSEIAYNQTSEEQLAYDQLVPRLKETYKEAKSFELHYPESDTTSILVEVSNSKGLYYNMDYLFFDQNTLKELEVNSIYGKYQNADFADKVIRMNYDIHIGAIGGLAGKLIAFLASLIAASLPVTGIILWYGKKFKNIKKPELVLKN